MKQPGNIRSSALARCFSSSVVLELARTGQSPSLARLLEESLFNYEGSSTDPVRNLFDAAFRTLRRQRLRHEYVYKSALMQKVLLGTHSLRTASMLTEVRAGACKADVVVFNGTAAAYEIKSERDSLLRLEQQIDAYRRVFAQVSVIVGENHLREVERMVPQDVGILSLTSRYQIHTRREALLDVERTCVNAIFESLSQSQASKILQRQGFELPKVPNTRRYAMLREMFIELTPEVAHREMVTVVKQSKSLLPLEAFITDLPESLRAACLPVRLVDRDRERLLRALETSVEAVYGWGR